jgi:transcriptional antiterminator RfaH
LLCKQDKHPTDGFSRAPVAHAVPPWECGADWYVAYTKSRQESVAEFNLQQQDFETYLPMFKVIKKQAARPGNMEHAYEPMFPRYLFFKPASRKQSIATARSSRGVTSVVTFGTELAVVPPDVVHTIRELEAQRNDADIDSISPFQPGCRVRLRDTALCGIEGVVQAVGAKRVVLLMHILGRQKTLKVKHGQLELV